jgi:hypothetical protein
MKYKTFTCQHCKTNFKSYKIYRQVKYCSRLCCGFGRRKPFIIKKGYKRILLKGHPRTDGKGYVREHILVMEKKLGRFIKTHEVVHHLDGNKLNNNPDNLSLLTSQSEHMIFHRSKKI